MVVQEKEGLVGLSPVIADIRLILKDNRNHLISTFQYDFDCRNPLVIPEIIANKAFKVTNGLIS